MQELESKERGGKRRTPLRRTPMERTPVGSSKKNSGRSKESLIEVDKPLKDARRQIGLLLGQLQGGQSTRMDDAGETQRSKLDSIAQSAAEEEDEIADPKKGSESDIEQQIILNTNLIQEDDLLLNQQDQDQEEEDGLEQVVGSPTGEINPLEAKNEEDAKETIPVRDDASPADVGVSDDRQNPPRSAFRDVENLDESFTTEKFEMVVRDRYVLEEQEQASPKEEEASMDDQEGSEYEFYAFESDDGEKLYQVNENGEKLVQEAKEAEGLEVLAEEPEPSSRDSNADRRRRVPQMLLERSSLRNSLRPDTRSNVLERSGKYQDGLLSRHVPVTEMDNLIGFQNMRPNFEEQSSSSPSLKISEDCPLPVRAAINIDSKKANTPLSISESRFNKNKAMTNTTHTPTPCTPADTCAAESPAAGTPDANTPATDALLQKSFQKLNLLVQMPAEATPEQATRSNERQQQEPSPVSNAHSHEHDSPTESSPPLIRPPTPPQGKMTSDQSPSQAVQDYAEDMPVVDLVVREAPFGLAREEVESSEPLEDLEEEHRVQQVQDEVTQVDQVEREFVESASLKDVECRNSGSLDGQEMMAEMMEASDPRLMELVGDIVDGNLFNFSPKAETEKRKPIVRAREHTNSNLQALCTN